MKRIKTKDTALPSDEEVQDLVLKNLLKDKQIEELKALRQKEVRALQGTITQISAPSEGNLIDQARAEIHRLLKKIEIESDPNEIEAFKKQRALLKNTKKGLRRLLREINELLQKYTRFTHWKEEIPPILKVIINDIEQHSMDKEEAINLAERRGWGGHEYTYKSGKDEGKTFLHDYVLYVPDYDRLLEKLKAERLGNYTKQTIWLHLNALIQCGCIRKMGRSNPRAGMVYAAGFYRDTKAGWVRHWLFSGEDKRKLQNTKISQIPNKIFY